MQLSGDAHDIFAVDVFYHQSCYLKYAFSKSVEEEVISINSEREHHTMEAFFHKIKTKILRDKCAYLLNELLNDIKVLSEEQGLETPVINCTKSLKRKLICQFEENISFSHLVNMSWFMHLMSTPVSTLLLRFMVVDSETMTWLDLLEE